MTGEQKPVLSSPEAQIVDSLASQCVKCALCLPHCPTYLLTEDENESPRGRIALFQAIAQEMLPLDEKAKSHLDLCLGCSACERVCPAKVEYGQLLDQGRHLINTLNPALARQSASGWIRLFKRLLPSRQAMRSLHWLLWGTEKLGLRRFTTITHLTRLLGLQRFEALLPQPLSIPHTFKDAYAPLGPERGSVMLFLGCLTSMCDATTLRAAIEVLRICGYHVFLPPNQTCCGAINLHAGELAEAKHLSQTNQQAFQSTPQKIDAIVSLATGCTVVLAEKCPNVVDIVSFLVHQAAIPVEKLKPLDIDVWNHIPCTRRNVLRECSDPEILLKKIPGLRLQTIVDPNCCGAAGSYMLEHPDISDTLGDKLLISIDPHPIDNIATTNIGCAMHLQQRLKHRQSKAKTCHPVVLLAQSLGCL